jgi:hypothetical protein
MIFKSYKLYGIEEKHFSDSNGDLDIKAPDLYVKDIKGRTIKIYTDFS